MIRVLLVDDEELARERLKRLIAEVPGYVCCGEAANGEEALTKCRRLQPDVVLMDIRMPCMDGLTAAQRLVQWPEPPAIIFCTAYDQYAVAAFQVHALGYLLKPVRREALAQALQQAGRLNRVQLNGVQQQLLAPTEAQPQKKQLTARSQRGVELINIDDIFYLMADQKYVTVYHIGGEVLIDDTLKELEQILVPEFMRVHRNALINLRYVEALKKDLQGHYTVLLRGLDQPVPVSRRMLVQIRDYIEQLRDRVRQ
jgi:two-component system, LytTR family, response regulator AlgR